MRKDLDFAYNQSNVEFDFEGFSLEIRKNGTAIMEENRRHFYYDVINGSVIAEANGSSDYFELFVYHGLGSNLGYESNKKKTYFMGFKFKF